ncbi:Zinc finger CCHC domain-containing protein 8 [Vitis vinifera]|uniref:Zinc finger CCHC domain-containing protein 8 n=1 Tax=Vitis vinifera TaxID=29760 RepID=A0A438ED19_VITVI|nr:Zinc finger CCHC domain-containing protein 8 [Vitis vinifera]
MILPFSGYQDSDEVLESGDETYFPALHVGLGPEKTSIVSFWMDNQVKEKKNEGFISLNDNAIPLYDREYALGLTSMDDLNNLESSAWDRVVTCSHYMDASDFVEYLFRHDDGLLMIVSCRLLTYWIGSCYVVPHHVLRGKSESWSVRSTTIALHPLSGERGGVGVGLWKFWCPEGVSLLGLSGWFFSSIPAPWAGCCEGGGFLVLLSLLLLAFWPQLFDEQLSCGVPQLCYGSFLHIGLETLDASRCFNCGSYNHSLKECPKPRDTVAVNNARKQHQSKRNQPVGPRIATRYYQNSPGGKYDGLKPGVLGPETRKILNLGEFDPPPWLNRMREIGYPPGYLDEETREEEDKENLKLNTSILQKTMSVDFPGINAPIPEHADERRWTTSQLPVSFDSLRNRANLRSNCSSESISNGLPHNQRGPRDYRDGGFPGYSPTMFDHSRGYSGFSLSRPSEYFSLRGDNPNGYSGDAFSPRGDLLMRGPSLGRSMSDRGRSSLFLEGSSHTTDTLLPYASSGLLQSPHDYGSFRFEAPAYEGHWRPY